MKIIKTHIERILLYITQYSVIRQYLAITSEHFELGVKFLQEEDDDLQLVQCLRVDGSPGSLQSFLLQPVAEQTPCLQQELCVLDADIQRHQATPYYHGNYVVHALQHLLPWPHDIHLE